MNRSLKRNLLAIGTIIFWSTAFPVTRMIGDALTAANLAFIRILSAAIFLMIIWLARKDRKAPEKDDILLFILSGATGFGIYLIVFSQGLKTITSAESSVIIAFTPVLVAILSRVIYKEKLPVIGWISIFGAFAGVAILMLWDNGLNIKAGMLWTLSASCLFAVYNLLNRKLSSKGYSSIDIVTFSMLISVIMLIWTVPSAAAQIQAASITPVLLAIYLGVFSSAISYALWGAALALADKSSEVTNYMFVTPMLATLEGIIWLKELPTIGTYLGGGLIIVMIVLFNLTKDRA